MKSASKKTLVRSIWLSHRKSFCSSPLVLQTLHWGWLFQGNLGSRSIVFFKTIGPPHVWVLPCLVLPGIASFCIFWGFGFIQHLTTSQTLRISSSHFVYVILLKDKCANQLQPVLLAVISMRGSGLLFNTKWNEGKQGNVSGSVSQTIKDGCPLVFEKCCIIGDACVSCYLRKVAPS